MANLLWFVKRRHQFDFVTHLELTFMLHLRNGFRGILQFNNISTINKNKRYFPLKSSCRKQIEKKEKYSDLTAHQQTFRVVFLVSNGNTVCKIKLTTSVPLTCTNIALALRTKSGRDMVPHKGKKERKREGEFVCVYGREKKMTNGNRIHFCFVWLYSW